MQVSYLKVFCTHPWCSNETFGVQKQACNRPIPDVRCNETHCTLALPNQPNLIHFLDVQGFNELCKSSFEHGQLSLSNFEIQRWVPQAFGEQNKDKS